MIVRISPALLPRRGRSLLVLALLALPLVPSCTKSEDTEPFVPAVEGAKQPSGKGDLLSEDAACSRLSSAATAAYKRLGCDAPEAAKCPAYLRPGGGSGCYEYFEDSVAACEKAYKDAASCRNLSPCIATAMRNDALPTCESVDEPGTMGGAGGADNAMTGGAGGEGPVTMTEGGAGNAGGAPPVEVTGGAGGTPSL